MVTRARPSFTFGIEEEYFLVDARTRALVSEPPKRMLDACKAELGGQFSSEYQRSQIEVATAVCMTASDACADLGRLRKGVAAILSASSPFWQGENTGLKSYRTAINGATPRSGMPESFASWRHYQKAIGTLVRSGVIEDATKIWWDLRPSARFPTLELRITDICPLVEDAVCIAVLFRCLCRCLCRRARKGARVPSQPLLLLNENRWRAQRYGLEQGFIDPDREKVVASTALVDELLELVRDDADCAAPARTGRLSSTESGAMTASPVHAP